MPGVGWMCCSMVTPPRPDADPRSIARASIPANSSTRENGRTASDPDSPSIASAGFVTRAPDARSGMFGVRRVNDGHSAPHGVVPPPIVIWKLFHARMIVFIADLKLFVMPSHIPETADLILPGRPVTKPTTVFHAPTIQS